MGYYAIALIKRGAEDKGARILNTDTLIVSNLTNEQLISLITKTNDVRNLGAKNNELLWTQGTSSRYTVLSAASYKPIENRNSIVVIGYYEEGKDRSYLVTNYIGNIAIIDEQKLIEYGKEHTLANCKVVTRDEKDYIYSISGELPKLSKEAQFDYDVESRTIYVSLPMQGIDKLVLPNRIKGNAIVAPEEMIVQPRQLANKITHLVLPNQLKLLIRGLCSEVPNLKSIVCDANLDTTWNRPFEGCESIEEVYMRTTKNYTYQLFSNLSKLKVIKFASKPTVLSEDMYRGCISMDIKDMLYEGIEAINTKSFRDCLQITKVTLPKSVKTLASSAFKGCKNIKEFRITNGNLLITKDYKYKSESEKVTEKLLEDAKNAILYCPYSFPTTIIKELVAEHVKIVRDEPTEDDKNIETRQLKGKTLGVSIRANDIALSASEALGFLSLVSDEVWRNYIVENVKAMLNSLTWGNQSFTIGDRGSFMLIYIQNIKKYGEANIKQARAGEKYLYMMDNRALRVVLISRSLTREYIERCLKMGKYKEIAYKHKQYENKFILKIPSLKLNIKPREINKVYEQEDSLILELKNGNKHEVKF